MISILRGSFTQATSHLFLSQIRILYIKVFMTSETLFLSVILWINGQSKETSQVLRCTLLFDMRQLYDAFFITACKGVVSLKLKSSFIHTIPVYRLLSLLNASLKCHLVFFKGKGNCLESIWKEVTSYKVPTEKHTCWMDTPGRIHKHL